MMMAFFTLSWSFALHLKEPVESIFCKCPIVKINERVFGLDDGPNAPIQIGELVFEQVFLKDQM